MLNQRGVAESSRSQSFASQSGMRPDSKQPSVPWAWYAVMACGRSDSMSTRILISAPRAVLHSITGVIWAYSSPRGSRSLTSVSAQHTWATRSPGIHCRIGPRLWVPYVTPAIPVCQVRRHGVSSFNCLSSCTYAPSA